MLPCSMIVPLGQIQKLTEMTLCKEFVGFVFVEACPLVTFDPYLLLVFGTLQILMCELHRNALYHLAQNVPLTMLNEVFFLSKMSHMNHFGCY